MTADHCPGCGTIFPGDITNEHLGHAEQCPVWLGAEGIAQLHQELHREETPMAEQKTEEIDLMKALVESLPDPTDPSLVPPDIKRAIDNYVQLRRRPGDFVLSVLKNNLAMAIGRADHNSLRVIAAIVGYCYNEIPAPCWGSHDIVEAWITPKSDDESMVTTQQRARREGLRRVILENSGLLRVETDDGQRLRVTGAADHPEAVIVTAREWLP